MYINLYVVPLSFSINTVFFGSKLTGIELKNSIVRENKYINNIKIKIVKLLLKKDIKSMNNQKNNAN